MNLIGNSALKLQSLCMNRQDFLAQLPRSYPDDIMAAKVGAPGFDLPDLASLVPYQPGDPSGPNLSVTSGSDSNVVLLPSGFSPTSRLRIIFSAQASGNTVVLGTGADPAGEFKIHATNSIVVIAGADRRRSTWSCKVRAHRSSGAAEAVQTASASMSRAMPKARS